MSSPRRSLWRDRDQGLGRAIDPEAELDGRDPNSVRLAVFSGHSGNNEEPISIDGLRRQEHWRHVDCQHGYDDQAIRGYYYNLGRG